MQSWQLSPLEVFSDQLVKSELLTIASVQQHGDQCALYVQVSTSWVSLPLPLVTMGHWHQDCLKKIVPKIKIPLAALFSIFVLSDIQFSSFHTTHDNAARLGDNCNDKWLLSCHFIWFGLLHIFNAFNKKIWVRRFSHKLDGKSVAFLRTSCINRKEKTVRIWWVSQELGLFLHFRASLQNYFLFLIKEF